MGWDASRPVPWRRLTKEWVIYAGIMAVVFAVFFHGKENLPAIIGGLLVSGPLYIGLGFVLAKFGYQRARLGDASARRSSSSSDVASGSVTAATDSAERPRPAPTRRTSSGSNRPSKGKRR